MVQYPIDVAAGRDAEAVAGQPAEAALAQHAGTRWKKSGAALRRCEFGAD